MGRKNPMDESDGVLITNGKKRVLHADKEDLVQKTNFTSFLSRGSAGPLAGV